MSTTEDHDHARLEDDGGPPAPESVATCGVVDKVYGLVCDREPGHDGRHRGYMEEHDVVLFWN